MSRLSLLLFGLLSLVLISGCDNRPTNLIQGYVEGEFVYVSSPLAGTVKSLSVQRGQQVKAGDELFALDDITETAALDEADRRIAQAQANLEDARKPKRPPEIASMEAQLEQTRVEEAMAEKDFIRQQNLSQTGAGTKQDLDHARSAMEADMQAVARMQADLETAKMGSRTDQITAAQQEVAARQAELAQARWNLSQKKQSAGESAAVFDTLYRTGEWVAAGKPVVVLLPPRDVKVRAFVPESRLGGIHIGQSVKVSIDGAASVLSGTVSFVSPQAEFTPPVIYSQENRSKLVFLIEITFSPDDAATLHPGQPVEVEP